MRTTRVLAADVGGSSTRAAVCDQAGSVLSHVTEAGANPNAAGLDASATLIRSALDDAWAAAGPAEGAPLDVVVGLAGGTRITTDSEFLRAITPPGAPTPRIVSDLAVAFASASAEVPGCVLVAGTGAVAGRIDGGELVDQRDGWGWLLGDAGAGFWIGRELVRATLRSLERREPARPLHEAALHRAGAHDRAGLVQACYAQPPIWLAGFAPLISAYGDDPDARVIASQAVDHLTGLLLDLHPVRDQPLVLAGSVATAPGPVSELLHRRLAGTVDGQLLTARSGTIGALWTALQQVGVHDHQVHARLVAQLSRT